MKHRAGKIREEILLGRNFTRFGSRARPQQLVDTSTRPFSMQRIGEWTQISETTTRDTDHT